MPHIEGYAHTCWLCERRLYRGRYGLIFDLRATAEEGKQRLHGRCAKLFDTEGENAARAIVKLEQREDA